MKRVIYICLLFFVFINTEIYSEIVVVDWKGSDFIDESSPKWLNDYLKTNNEQIIRKQFNLSYSDIIFFATGSGDTIEYSEDQASKDAIHEASIRLRKELQLEENKKMIISGLTKKWSFWQEISDVKDKATLKKLKAILEGDSDDSITIDSSYKSYCVFVISKDSWEKCKDANK